jgi:uncharacterized protein YdeI (YjbR/CyaY-like superfamily)
MREYRPVAAAAKPGARKFDAVLEPGGGNLRWTIIYMPFDVAKVWGARGQLKVKGEVNGFAFRTSLFPDGKGRHFLMVNKKMQAGGKTAVGAKARFRMEPDTEKREVTTPGELLTVLQQSRPLLRFYESLSYSIRNEIAKSIQEGKHSETRRRRAEQMAERLMETMEAERELPPVLQLALRRNPRAREGWELMSPGHRRRQLLGIFYYRNPEARARRVAKAVEEMVFCAETRGTR